MHSKVRIVQFVFTLALSLVALFGLELRPANAQSSEGVERHFGLTSLNAGQSLRFNVVNADSSRLAVRVTISFDIYGLGGPDTSEGGVCTPGEAVAACTNNLRPVRSEMCTVTLRSGAAAICDLNIPEPHAFVNSSLVVEGQDANGVLATLELRENNRIILVHPGLIRGFNPQPNPPTN